MGSRVEIAELKHPRVNSVLVILTDIEAAITGLYGFLNKYVYHNYT